VIRKQEEAFVWAVKSVREAGGMREGVEGDSERFPSVGRKARGGKGGVSLRGV